MKNKHILMICMICAITILMYKSINVYIYHNSKDREKEQHYLLNLNISSYIIYKYNMEKHTKKIHMLDNIWFNRCY